MNSRLSFPTGVLIFLSASLFLAARSATPVLAQMPEVAPSTTMALTLNDAINAAEANNRTIRVAQHALLSEVLKVQSGLAEADHRFIQALLNLAAAQADFDKAIGEDQ